MAHSPGSLNIEAWLRDLRDTLDQYKDEHIILDRILFKGREISTAEAGTVYLLDGDELVFAYTHNDFLFPTGSAHTKAYLNLRIPVSPNSITGYVALTRSPLNLANVRKLKSGAPYKFDDSFDEANGYKTVSMLTIPIISRGQRLMGVLQLINSLDFTGRPQPFSKTHESWISLLAHEAGQTLEMSQNVLNGISRLMRIVNLHDASETGPHSERVGALAAELYQFWADKRGHDPGDIRYYKSQLRLAAMLHDIGKVGVSDTILRKGGRLNEDEFKIMQTHAYLGSTLFQNDAGDITDLAAEVTLHHHQRWDGKGYTGDPRAPILAGLDIPLSARVTAIADVFDALVSYRCYKTVWPPKDAFDFVRNEAGKHFDPELAYCFLEIPELVKSIYERFPDRF